MNYVKSINDVGHDVYAVAGLGEIRDHARSWPGFVGMTAHEFTPRHAEVYGPPGNYRLNGERGAAYAAMPLVRLARSLGLISRASYKIIKCQIERAMSYAYPGLGVRELRAEIRRLAA